MKIPTKHLVGTLLGLALAWTARAGSITNNFNSGADYLNNGVAGTMWDGVYLGFGDVPNGNNGGDGNGATLEADENAFPGFLTLQSTDTSWAGAGDDGFYLWKVVSGDFDVSVRNVQPYDNSAYHFSGLLVRAYTANGPAWGAPFSTTSTNAVENWLNITRFNEFSIGDQVRYATNANDIQISAPFNSGSTNYNTETNDDRYFRITRVGNVFSFYDKTNQSDNWTLESTIPRPDLAGIPMQVGIEDATFTTATPFTYYTDFELSGTNVNASPTIPADASGLTSAVSGNDVVLSWTKGAGSAGSVVLVRANNPHVLSLRPINGFTYTGNTNFGSGDLLGDGLYAVYAGTSSSVTISGLGSDLNTYSAAVYAYTGSGSTISYSTNPPTATFAGPGQVTSVTLSLNQTNIPVNGVAMATVIGHFSTGDSNDFSLTTNVVWSSSDTNVVVGGLGAVTGVGVGTALVTATLGGQSASVTVHVVAPAFTDNFDTFHDFVADGVPGSKWDGVYLGTTPGGDTGGNVPLCAANIGANDTLLANIITNTGANTMLGTVVSNDVLTVQSDNTAWAGTSDNGFFLFKQTEGDFQVAVHIASYTGQAFHFTGLMVRPANPDGTALGGTEGWIYWDRFDEFGISTLARNDVNASDIQTFNTDGDTTDFWLLINRVDGTNFYFFKKANAADPWQLQPSLTVVRPDLAGVPLQVGIDDATYTATPLQQAQFDNFMLDATNLVTTSTEPAGPTGLQVVPNADGTVDVSWNPSTNGVGSLVVMHAGSSVNAQPANGVAYTGNATFGMGDELGTSNYVVYVGTGTNVTVSGLIPGTTYYVAVYAYSGAGATLSYSHLGAVTGNTVAEGVVAYVDVMPGGATIANDGILPFTAVAVYTNGAMQNVSDLVSISSDPAGAVVGTNGILTGLTNGNVTVFATFNAVTSTNNPVVTVRNPAFSDNFNVSHDYLANGITGSGWDGLYEYPSFGVPGTTYASSASAQTFSADANITSNGVLTVISENVGWEFGQNDGFFLFKYVPGDFQVAVHITAPLLTTNGAVIATYNYPGLLARAYAVTNGLLGGPAGGTNGEDWVSWARFDEFGSGTRAEMTINNGTTRPGTPDVGSDQRWLLMVRQNGTGFRFYQRSSATDPWQPSPAGQTFNIPQFAGMPMQVGIMEGGFDSGNPVTGQFDHFMLDTTTSGLQLEVMNAGNGNVMLMWPADPGAQLESTDSLNPANWQPVGGTPTLGSTGYTQTVPIGSANQFFRLKN